MATSGAPHQLDCLLGVSERTLSALRDGALGHAETARLDTHVATCPACRTRLAAFDGLATLLRAEPAPAPDERLWRAVSSAMNTPAPIRRLRFLATSASMLPSWSGVATATAAIALIIGFVVVLGLHRAGSPTLPASTVTPSPALTSTPTTAPQPTATPIQLLPTQPLRWGVAQSVSAASQPIIFANDGESAYTCEVDAVLRVWRTYNRGASWVAASQVPNDPSMNMCELVVDATDPSVAALAWSPRGSGGGDIYTGLMTTVDGGRSWQAAPSQPFVRIDQLDSRGGEIYALRETGSGESVDYHIWASGDRMRTWRQVDYGLPPGVVGFWLQPDGSSILAVTNDGPNPSPSQLWLSPDNGATWRQLTVPGGLPHYFVARYVNEGAPPNSIVARWVGGQFAICVSNATVATTDANNSPSVTCSTDSGATWHTRPLLELGAKAGSVGVNLIAIADDGAVLASGLNTVYRLAADSNRWQSLGPLPQGAQPSVSYCPAPGAGILWTLQIPTGSGVRGHIFIANYTP